MQYSFGSLKGLERSSNKDGIAVFAADDSFYDIFAVFDGVSSLKNSKHAVNMSIGVLRSFYNKNKKNSNVNIKYLMEMMNNKILSSKYSDAATTCSLLAIPKVAYYPVIVASLGDSRVYGVHSQYVEQLTIDHSTPGGTNNLTHYLGMTNFLYQDINYIEFMKGFSSYLLCTDGFYSFFEHNKSTIHSAFLKTNSNKLSAILKDKIRGKNEDDASFIYVRVENV